MHESAVDPGDSGTQEADRRTFRARDENVDEPITVSGRRKVKNTRASKRFLVLVFVFVRGRMRVLAGVGRCGSGCVVKSAVTSIRLQSFHFITAQRQNQHDGLHHVASRHRRELRKENLI